MRRDGFTLIELVIVAALLTIVSLLGLTAMRASGNSVKLSQAQALAQADVQAVLSEITHELEMAVKAAREDAPAVVGLQLREVLLPVSEGDDVDATVVRELVFHRASEDNGGQWSGPITYRFINEDLNRNGLLDGTESDLDANRRPTSVLVRLEDLTGDADFDDVGEERLIGSAHTITDAAFDYDGVVLTVTIEATRVIAGTETLQSSGQISTRTVRSTQSCRIYPLN